MNYKHLSYFWVTARAGGVGRAGAQLHTTPQTLSGQIKLLEERLGRKLLRKAGRGVELTDDGRVALRYADDIFALGSELEGTLQGKRGTAAQVLDLRVGIEDAVAKPVAYQLLEPALQLAELTSLLKRPSGNGTASANHTHRPPASQAVAVDLEGTPTFRADDEDNAAPAGPLLPAVSLVVPSLGLG